MISVKKHILDLFGETLMLEVRDRAINEWTGIIEGRMKSPISQKIFEKLQHLQPEDKIYLKQLFSEVVDTTLHFLLSLVEESEQIDIVFHADSGETLNIKEISDGLAGELYTEDGWIARFSERSVL